MAIVRWEPFGDVSRFQERMNRLLDDPFFRWGRAFDESAGTLGFAPPLDIYEDQEGLTVSVEVPGIDPKDVQVKVDNNVLTLHGERKLEKEDKRDSYLRIERAYGTFTRSFTLPATVNAEKTHAQYKNGVLKIFLPKKEEAKPKQITVKVE